MDSGAGRLGRGGEPTDVAQRVQPEIVRHHEAAMRLGSLEQPLRQLLAGPDRPALAEEALDQCGLVMQLADSIGLVGQKVLTLACRLNVETLSLGEAADERHPLLLAAKVAASLLQPEPLGHGAIAELGPTQPAEPAIAPRSPPADRPRLEHHGLDSMLAGKVVGAGKPSIPTSDDRDLGTPILPERNRSPRRPGAAGLPECAEGAVAFVVAVMVEHGT